MRHLLTDPFGFEPATELIERIRDPKIRHGLNALVRNLENQLHVHIRIDSNPDFAPTAESPRGKCTVSKLKNSNIIRIVVPPVGSEPLLHRFLLAHELGHLAMRHGSITQKLSASGSRIAGVLDQTTGCEITVQSNDDLIDNFLEKSADDFAIAMLMRYNFLFERRTMDPTEVLNFAERYTERWDSHREEEVERLIKHIESEWPCVAPDNHLIQVMEQVFAEDARLRSLVGENGIRIDHLATRICALYRERARDLTV